MANIATKRHRRVREMEINVAELENEIAQLTPEQLKQQLLDAKVRQRVATKKYYNPVKAKEQRQKRSAELKEMAEIAKKQPATVKGYANLYEQILAEASEMADQKLASEAAEAAEISSDAVDE